MQIMLPAKSAVVAKECDVLVVGGGPAGVGAAMSAARGGAKVILLEKLSFLGGNITACYVETCNGFLRRSDFKPVGLFGEMQEKYRARYDNSHDVRPGAPHRFSSEYLKIFLDGFVSGAGVEVIFHSFVNEVVMEGNRIAYAIIQTKQGPIAVKAKTIIDCTGDADVAYAAGVPYDIGRDTDHLCQPGTLAFRIVGVDVEKLTEGGVDQLGKIAAKYKQDYRAGLTGLKCKRQDLPFGRMTAAGEISYVNYPCAYGVDPTNFEDLSRAEKECREYIQEMYEYMKDNFDGFQNIEISSIATEIGFRDSRRIHGEYKLTIEDMEANRHFDDVITVFPRFYDMLAPDAYMDGDGSFEGAGYKGHIYVQVEDNRSFEIPYRSLLPVGVENLIVAGRSISASHVAEAGIRAILACMYTGQAAGTAASIALFDRESPKTVNITKLQNSLRAQKLMLESPFAK